MPMRLTYGPDHPRTLGALLDLPGARPGAPIATDASGTLDRPAFAELVGRVAGGFAAAGLEPGDRIALWLPNGIPYLAAIFASARLGILAVHINTRFRAAEVGSLLRRTRAAALVTDWGFAPVDFPSILAGLPADDRAALRAVFGVNLPKAADSLAGLPVRPLDDGASDTTDNVARPDSPCLTFTTSGTTSGPKLVLHDQRTIAGHAHDVAGRIGIGPGDAMLGALPLCGTFGNAAAMATIAGGAHLVLMAQFDGEAAAGLIRRHGITHILGGDDMIARIVAASGDRPFETVRLTGFAAFHSTASEAARAADVAGLNPCGLYGSSEVQALFSFQEGRHRHLAGGVPSSPDARLSVRDPETGEPVAEGESGEIWISAPSRFVEYLDNPEATARALDPDGTFRTGDLGHLAGEGFVYEARMGDAMRLGGFLVSPEEIEAFLQQQDGIAGVQVVAAAPPGHDLAAVAFVTARPGATLDLVALRARCGDELARFKVPARIIEVERFPTVDSPNGPKVQKVRLREMAERALAES